MSHSWTWGDTCESFSTCCILQERMGMIYQEFHKTATAYPDHLFVIEVNKGALREISYSDIDRQVIALATRLQQLDLKAESRIVILSESRAEWVIAFLAANRVGGIVVPLDPERKEQEWLEFVAHSEPSVLIVTSRFQSSFEQLRRATPNYQLGLYFRTDGSDVTAESKVWQSFTDWTRPVDRLPRLRDQTGQCPEVAMILYTSATVGRSKAVQLTQQAIIDSSEYLYRFSEPETGSRILSIVPLHHVLGLNALLSLVFSASAMTLFPTISREKILRTFSEVRPHYVMAVPSFYEKLAADILSRLRKEAPKWLQKLLDDYVETDRTEGPRFKWLRKLLFRKVRQRLGGRIKCMASGGASLASPIIRLFYFLGIPLYEGYGMTETSGVFIFNRPHAYKIGTIGKPFGEGNVARIDHLDAQADAQGVGELCVKGPLIMKGYYRNDEANQEAFDGGGWFHTGDLARMDADGYISFVGRLKDVIVSSNGQNIYPDEIEFHFAQLPLIQELCVYGVPMAHSHINEQVCLRIVPDPKAVEQEGAEIVESRIRRAVADAGEQLAPFRRPSIIDFSYQPLPRTSTLKVKRFQLRQETILKMQSRMPHSERERVGIHKASGPYRAN